ncbi:MAG: substrate-binding domain-containing protein [Methylocystis sp.]|nr:substrate-binding domain-containing protein [Methylocystis sp.]MCA3583230.1 substrate-binding domain-containing protein [Methylocystis sp.]MCA3587565.1 substrate-binding domain-containing protein [Methylocystis sp.]MCA3590692.1 substrate-binding domain-containing protein [Methylocystis sp.]
MRPLRPIIVLAAALLTALPAMAAEFRVMTTGAPRKVIDMVAAKFAADTAHKPVLIEDTAGGVRRRIEAGEAADVVVATPAVLDALVAAGKIVPGSRIDFATTGVGVGIKEGLPKPDISTVDAIRKLVAEAPSIALPDPKAGGTSAVYIEGLFKRLGIADAVNAKAKLKAGGYAADLVASGDAIIVFHQISEIKPVKGVTLVGPLPAEIQLITTYSAALSTGAAADSPAKAFLAAINGPAGRAAVESIGMDPPK